MKKGQIRVFPYFNKGLQKPYWDMNIMVRAYPYTAKSEKVMLFEIAELAKSALYSVEYNVVSVDFRNKYNNETKLSFLCRLQRYAQSKGYSIVIEPLNFA